MTRADVPVNLGREDRPDRDALARLVAAINRQLRGGARPPLEVIVEYVDAHRDEFGVEPICRVLSEHGRQIAASTNYARNRRTQSARAMRDAVIMR